MKYSILIVLVILVCSITWGQKSPNLENDQISNRYSDSMMLVKFNQHANGELWKVKWDFNEPMDYWFGVQLNEHGRVFCLDLDGIPDCSANRSSGNHLHGELIDLQLPFLEHLFLSSNKLTGEIPDFTGIPYLLTLQLSANVFNGSIPNFSNLESLVKLDLEYNNLDGEIPEFLWLPNLESLYLGFNMLSGKFPSFEESANLKHIFANSNELKFDINELTKMENLVYLLLNNNRLFGEIPDFSDWPKLETLILSDNRLTGCFVSDLANSLKRFEIDGNNISICSQFNFFIANAFSPNGDGLNDKFEFYFDPNSKVPNQISLKIYADNKQLVYHNSNYQNNWDGRSMLTGDVVQQGLYFYRIVLDQTEETQGWVFIKH